MTNDSHRTRTLVFCTVLHGFTHIYHVALFPLYLPIQESLALESLGKATLLVTVMMVAYFLPSYPVGMLADRVSRKKLLSIGLAINGLGFVGLGLSTNYTVALASVILAGLGGSFYHPAATALVARLYPIGTGKALGLVGMGASIGFFLGPIYTGWRAALAGWRAPVLELGALGMCSALIFFLVADEERFAEQTEAKEHISSRTLFPDRAIWLFFVAACFFFSLRDFTGSSMGTMSSLFLQKAHDFDVKQTGSMLSTMFIASILGNPLFGRLSDRGRIRWSVLVLSVAAVMLAVFPHLPRKVLIPGLVLYGFFFLASFPIVEAGLMEAVPDAVRARVFGLFITVGGLVGNISHWLIGKWVENLGPAAESPAGFYNLFGSLAVLVVLSVLGLPFLQAIHRRGLSLNNGRSGQIATEGVAPE